MRAVVGESRSCRRFLGWLLAGLVAVGVGVAIGSRIAAPKESSPQALDRASGRAGTSNRPTLRRQPAASAGHTPAGAVVAAARSITEFDGDVLLEPARLRAVVAHIASVRSRARLIEAFDQASAQTRAKLGADTVPKPVIVLRSIPVGYRIEHFSADDATIAIWYVGIVGSGATVQPQQSWRTQVVRLVWEAGDWKVSSFASSAGPAPPLSSTDGAASPGELFAAIPRFEEFERAEP
jgi:hypothetical protein